MRPSVLSDQQVDAWNRITVQLENLQKRGILEQAFYVSILENLYTPYYHAATEIEIIDLYLKILEDWQNNAPEEHLRENLVSELEKTASDELLKNYQEFLRDRRKDTVNSEGKIVPVTQAQKELYLKEQRNFINRMIEKHRETLQIFLMADAYPEGIAHFKKLKETQQANFDDLYDRVCRVAEAKASSSEVFDRAHKQLLEERPGLQKTTQPLLEAAINGDHERLIQLIDATPRKQRSKFINETVDEEGNTSLHIACLNGKKEIVKALLSYRETDPLKQNQEKYLSLHLAAKRGHVEIVDLLLTKRRKEKQLEARGAFDRTPLNMAVFEKQLVCAHYLMRAGANIHACDVDNEGKPGSSILKVAIWQQVPNIVRLLLQAGADKNLSLSQKKALLDEASHIGNLQTIELLLTQRFVEIKRSDAEAYFLTACQHKHQETGLFWFDYSVRLFSANLSSNKVDVFERFQSTLSQDVERRDSFNQLNRLYSTLLQQYTDHLMAIYHEMVLKPEQSEVQNQNPVAEPELRLTSNYAPYRHERVPQTGVSGVQPQSQAALINQFRNFGVSNSNSNDAALEPTDADNQNRSETLTH